jgi:hypothetical protein
MTKHKGAKDTPPQGKSTRAARGLASPGGSGTPPSERHQAAGERKPDPSRPRPDGKTGR